jgi:hypothetical protein
MLPSALLEGRRKSFAIWYMIFRQSPKDPLKKNANALGVFGRLWLKGSQERLGCVVFEP